MERNAPIFNLPATRNSASLGVRRTGRFRGYAVAWHDTVTGYPPRPVWIKLDGGQILHLRAIHRDDRKRLREELFLKLSRHSLRNRFFALKMDLTPDELTFLCDVDFVRHFAIVAEVDTGPRRRMVGAARFVREHETSANAEIAIAVVDDYQSMGIGTELFEHLVTSARERGVRRLEGVMLAQNLSMARLVRKIRLPRVTNCDSGILSMSLEL